MLSACLITNWVLNMSYFKTVQCKRNCKSYNVWYYILFHTENGLYGIWISGHTHMFCNFTNIPQWIPWKPEVSLSLPHAMTCTVQLNTVGNCHPLKTAKNTSYMKYITFEYKMICITKCVNVQHISEKLKFHNGMKSIVHYHTHTHTPMLHHCLSQLHETHQYIYI